MASGASRGNKPTGSVDPFGLDDFDKPAEDPDRWSEAYYERTYEGLRKAYDAAPPIGGRSCYAPPSEGLDCADWDAGFRDYNLIAKMIQPGAHAEVDENDHNTYIKGVTRNASEVRDMFDSLYWPDFDRNHFGGWDRKIYFNSRWYHITVGYPISPDILRPSFLSQSSVTGTNPGRLLTCSKTISGSSN